MAFTGVDLGTIFYFDCALSSRYCTCSGFILMSSFMCPLKEHMVNQNDVGFGKVEEAR